MDEVLTTEQVAAWLKMTVRAVRAAATRGELRGTRIGKEWRFKRADVQAVLDGGAT